MADIEREEQTRLAQIFADSAVTRPQLGAPFPRTQSNHAVASAQALAFAMSGREPLPLGIAGQPQQGGCPAPVPLAQAAAASAWEAAAATAAPQQNADCIPPIQLQRKRSELEVTEHGV